LSVDDEATTRELIAKHGLTFPVGHNADAWAIGALVNDDPLSCNPPGSPSTRPGVPWSASTPAVPSAGSFPKTSSA
jgi:hypothetical protein